MFGRILRRGLPGNDRVDIRVVCERGTYTGSTYTKRAQGGSPDKDRIDIVCERGTYV